MKISSVFIIPFLFDFLKAYATETIDKDDQIRPNFPRHIEEQDYG
jgi:hypothetical protein